MALALMLRPQKTSWLVATGPRIAASLMPELMGGGRTRVMVSMNPHAATGIECIGRDRNSVVRTNGRSHSIERDRRECNVIRPSFGRVTCNLLGRHCARTYRLQSTPGCQESRIGAPTSEDSYQLRN